LAASLKEYHVTNAFLPHSVEKAVLRLFEDLASPVSLSMKMLYESGSWDSLSSRKVDPRHYLDAESYWRDATAVSILRKLEDLPTSFDRKAVAEGNFLSSELQCFRTNLRLLPYLSPGLPETVEGVCSYIDRARKIVDVILGPCPDNVDGRFGPGATYGDRGKLATIPDKMSSEPTVTLEAWPYQFIWCGTSWANACSSSKRYPTRVRGNRFTTVPKDATKHRGIAVEPSINVFYQLGYGRVIRNRLSQAGIDLTKGQDIHRRVACEASIRGHLSTLDLSNASDTVCSNLVKLLLPPRWFRVLDDLRSKRTLFKNQWFLLEKFSSMGNGFTFELETLIFLALIMALDQTGQNLVAGQNVFVFGDDIIIPTEYSKAVIATLSFFGMEVNKEKSFVDGPFRESCGGDFFLGVDVRPHFLKESPDEPQQLISLANGLRRLTKDSLCRSEVIRRAWFSILDALPTNIRSCRGPNDLGDLCLHDDESRWSVRWRSSIRYIKVYRPARFRKVPWKFFRPDVILASALYGVPDGVPRGLTGRINGRQSEKHFMQLGGVSPRNAVLGYKVGWVARS
jgi:hypothetical protein